MSHKIIKSHPPLDQYFEEELKIPQDSLIQGLLSSIAIYLDRYQIALTFNITHFTPFKNLIYSFLQSTSGSFHRYPNILNDAVFNNISTEISNTLKNFKNNPIVYNLKVLVNIANIFGVFFKEISKKQIKTFGKGSKHMIIIWLYNNSSNFYILIPKNYYHISDDLLMNMQTNLVKLRHCGHELSDKNYSEKCKICYKSAYFLEIPGHKAKKMKHQGNAHPCTYCNKAKDFKCQFCNEYFCLDHQPKISCILCKKSKEVNKDKNDNEGEKKSLGEDKPTKGSEKVKNEDMLVKLSSQNPLIRNDLTYVLDQLLQKESIQKSITLFLSSDIISNILKSQRNSTDPSMLKLNKSLKTYQTSKSLKSESKIMASSLNTSVIELNKSSPFKSNPSLINFLSFAYTFSIQFVIESENSVSKYGFQGNFRVFMVLLNLKQQLKIITPDKFTKDDKRIKKIERRLIKKKKDFLRLCCGCLFDFNELKLMKYQDLYAKFSLKCETHKKNPNKLELDIVLKCFPNFHEGCSACNSKNSDFIICQSCKNTHCSDICEDYSNLMQDREVSTNICAFCKNKLGEKLRDSIEIRKIEVETHIYADSSLFQSKSFLNTSLDVSKSPREKLCIICGIFSSNIKGVCRICQKK